MPELLAKPLRDRAPDELAELGIVLGRLELLPVDEAIAELATALAASYGLRAADAVHLATAVGAGATRFVTNNSKDFPKSITEIDIVYAADLPDLPHPPSEAWSVRFRGAGPTVERSERSSDLIS